MTVALLNFRQQKTVTVTVTHNDNEQITTWVFAWKRRKMRMNLSPAESPRECWRVPVKCSWYGLTIDSSFQEETADKTRLMFTLDFLNVPLYVVDHFKCYIVCTFIMGCNILTTIILINLSFQAQAPRVVALAACTCMHLMIHNYYV